MKTILLRSLIYYGLVFLIGFILGTFRVLLLVPTVGEMYAELIEMPLMLIAIYYSAKFLVYRFSALPRLSAYLVIGVIALGLLLLTEFTLVLGLRGISFAQYIAARDPVSGIAYALSLCIYALMPFIISKTRSSRIDA